MIKYGFVLGILLTASSLLSQDYISELEHSVERSKGASGASIQYTLHLTPTFVKSYYAKNFDSGKLVKNESGEAIYFELTKTNGEEKEVVVIYLKSVTVVEFGVSYPKGNCHYNFDFFY
ncbi:MAG: hypothetical protein WDZ35_09185 [Crocinitomicaceae bacterium]